MIEYDNNNNIMEVSIETVHIPLHPRVSRGGFGISNMVLNASLRLCHPVSVIHVRANRLDMVPIPRHSNAKANNERIY